MKLYINDFFGNKVHVFYFHVKHKHLFKIAFPHHSMWYSFCDLRNVIVKLHIIKVKEKEREDSPRRRKVRKGKLWLKAKEKGNHRSPDKTRRGQEAAKNAEK